MPAGGSGAGGGGRYGAPGVTTDGRFFLMELFKFSRVLLSASCVGAAQLVPFTSEKVCYH